MDGSVIRAARESAGLSQDDLASRVGVGRTQISRIETGIRVPSVDVLVAIAEVLDIDLNLLKEGQVDDPAVDDPAVPDTTSATAI